MDDECISGLKVLNNDWTSVFALDLLLDLLRMGLPPPYELKGSIYVMKNSDSEMGHDDLASCNS